MSKIQWTGDTLNIVAGCTRKSPGCEHCYAESLSGRLARMGQEKYDGVTEIRHGKRRWTGLVRFHPEEFRKALDRKKPRLYFVNSMSDTFHPSLSNRQVAAMFGGFAATPRHTYQILTKHPERAADWFVWASNMVGPDGQLHPLNPVGLCYLNAIQQDLLTHEEADAAPHAKWPLPNVWIGTSTENQEYFDERLLHLRRCPAAVRFISAEPLLGPIDATAHLDVIDLAIVGGESGAGARDCDIRWITDLVAQCQGAGVAPFVKQLGSRSIWRKIVQHGSVQRTTEKRRRFKHPKGGDPEEWPPGLRVREWPPGWEAPA